MTHYSNARPYKRRRFRGMATPLVLFIVVAVLAAIIVPIASGYYKHRQVTLTVTNRERVCSSSTKGTSSCKYLIWTNHGVYEDSDSLVNGKFSSSDLYGMLMPGKTFACTVYGWRLGFFSMYPNIVNCKAA